MVKNGKKDELSKWNGSRVARMLCNSRRILYGKQRGKRVENPLSVRHILFFLTSFTIPLKIKIENIKGEAETMSDVKERKAPDRSHPR